MRGLWHLSIYPGLKSLRELTCYPRICLEEMRKTMKNHCCEGKHSPGKNSNPEPPEYEVGVPILHERERERERDARTHVRTCVCH